MEKYIGIIVAEIEEMDAIKNIMNNISEINLYNLIIYSGKINNKSCLLVRSGIGKVNAARTTQILTDNFNLECIINLGSAGSINDNLNIGDIIVAKALVQHDFDVTAFGREKGFIPETGKFFECNKQLVDDFSSIKLDSLQLIQGIIASGDIFLTDVHMKENIKNNFKAACVEMEGAAVAQVCHLNNVPFIIIRSISDTPNGQNQIDFNEYLKFASENCAKIINLYTK